MSNMSRPPVPRLRVHTHSPGNMWNLFSNNSSCTLPNMRLALALLLAPVLFAQAPKRLEFEVASVRPAGPAVNTAQTNAASQLSPQQIRLTYLSLRDFITRAYGV